MNADGIGLVDLVSADSLEQLGERNSGFHPRQMRAQAKVCAAALAKLLAGSKPDEPILINTCYSLVAPDYGISVAGVYKPADGQLKDVEGSGGVSPLDAPSTTRALEANFAEGWFKTITAEVFG